MKVVLLCAGYGTRLRRDLEAAGGRYAHLLGLPKPLLPVAGQPLLTRWVQEVWAELGESVSVAAVVNDRFLEDFRAWREGLGEERGAKVTLISDGTTRNEDRLGAVACMQVMMAIVYFPFFLQQQKFGKPCPPCPPLLLYVACARPRGRRRRPRPVHRG